MPDNNVDDMIRRVNAVRDFYEEATGFDHIGITIFTHHDYRAPPNRDEIARAIVDITQERQPPGGKHTTIIKGRMVDGPHFVCVLMSRSKTAIVYLTVHADDAGRLCEAYRNAEENDQGAPT